MKKLQNGFGVVPILISLVIIVAVGIAGWTVYNRQKKDNQSNKSSQSDQQNNKVVNNENVTQTLKLETAPMVSVQHNASWVRLTEFGYPRDGLVKTIDGVAFLISFTRTQFKYDYMNRSAGGAYPIGKLSKAITVNGKQYYIGTTNQFSSAFISTCQISTNGACSLLLPDNYGYMIIDMMRHSPSESDYKARSPLELSNPADQKALEEFTEIMDYSQVLKVSSHLMVVQSCINNSFCMAAMPSSSTTTP